MTPHRMRRKNDVLLLRIRKQQAEDLRFVIIMDASLAILVLLLVFLWSNLL